jgi:hypothetical protein
MTTQQFLHSIGACGGAMTQVAARPLKLAVYQSVRGDWLVWLGATMAGKRGWPSRAAINLVLGSVAFARNVEIVPPRSSASPSVFVGDCMRAVQAIAGVPPDKQVRRGMDNEALAAIAVEFKRALLPIAALEDFSEE